MSRPFKLPHRILLVGYLVFTFLAVQGLRVHFHAFADHEPLHGHDHAVELHVDGVPTDSGHDEASNETVLAKFAILKLKQAHLDDTALAFATDILSFAHTGPVLWRLAPLIHPFHASAVRTPPSRAPPR